MLLQRKIGKSLVKLENSTKSKGQKVKKGSKCYVKLIRTWSAWVTIALITIALMILVFQHSFHEDNSLQSPG